MMPSRITKSNVFAPMLSAWGARICPPVIRPEVSFSRRPDKSVRLNRSINPVAQAGSASKTRCK